MQSGVVGGGGQGLRPVIVDLSGATSLLHVTPLLPTRTLPLPSHRSACTPPYIPPPPSLHAHSCCRTRHAVDAAAAELAAKQAALAAVSGGLSGQQLQPQQSSTAASVLAKQDGGVAELQQVCDHTYTALT